MAEDKGRDCRIEIETALEAIKEAKDKGRPVILLCGSGVSVDAGFPVTAHLSEYLVRFYLWLKKQGVSPASYLRDHPWPSRHHLNSVLWSQFPQIDRFRKALYQARLDINREAMLDELRHFAPTASSAIEKLAEIKLAEFKLDKEFENVKTAVNDKLGAVHENIGYRSLLNFICDRDGNLIDSFFDHFSRRRRPSTTHQFVSYIANLLDIRLILTTNFDTFIDSSLRDERLECSLYEITRNSPIPSARLIRNQPLALVKLHGGAYGLRTGLDLDDRLSSGARAEYREYFSPSAPGALPPLVIICGYSGSDRRVMDILSMHLLDWKQGDPMRIIWISRESQPPKRLPDIMPTFKTGCEPPVGLCEYRETRLFLQELYQYLERQHPVGHRHYRAFAAIPRNLHVAQIQKESLVTGFRLEGQTPGTIDLWSKDFATQIENASSAMFFAEQPGAGCSAALAKACQVLTSTHTIIWIDASEHRSLGTMFSTIEDAFHNYDRHLTRISHPLMFSDADFITRQKKQRHGERYKDDFKILSWTEDWERYMGIRWLRNTLRRGRYVLAIDSCEEFCQGHPATNDHIASIDAMPYQDKPRQVAALTWFFQRLLGKNGKLTEWDRNFIDDCNIGESKVFLAVRKNENMHKWQQIRSIMDLSYNSVQKEPSPRNAVDAFRQKLKSTVIDDHIDALVLMLAAFCRRPRSRAALISVTASVLKYFEKSAPTNHWPKLLQDTIAQVVASTAGEDEQIKGYAEVALQRLSKEGSSKPLLFRQEGGFYWMRAKERNEIFDYIAPQRSEDDNHVPVLSHGQIADIYQLFAEFCHDDLYERSQDLSAFMEYFYHRSMAFAWQPNQELRLKQAKILMSAIEFEKEKLLARGKITTVLSHMGSFLSLIIGAAKKESGPGTTEYRVLILRLLAVYADLCVACGHPREAFNYRLLQAQIWTDHINWLLDETPVPDVCARLNMAVETDDDPAGIFNRYEQDLKKAEDVLKAFYYAVDLLLVEIETQDRSVEFFRRGISTLRPATDLMIDWGIVLMEPVILTSPEYFRLYDEMQWESIDDRKHRKDIASEAFAKALDTATRLRLVTASQLDTERAIRARVRGVENELRNIQTGRFDVDFQVPAASADSAEAVGLAEISRICEKALDEIKLGPNTMRRRRYKCYILLARARAFASANPPNFAAAAQDFNRATSALSRARGASEQAAMGIVNLFRAESLLKQHHDVAHLGECERILSQSQSALEHEEGRVENRWRTFHNYLTAKLNYMWAQLPEITAEAREHRLFTSMRYIVSAFTNTGMRSDRRIALNQLLRKIRAAYRKCVGTEKSKLVWQQIGLPSSARGASPTWKGEEDSFWDALYTPRPVDPPDIQIITKKPNLDPVPESVSLPLTSPKSEQAEPKES